jgi:flagellar P-ring protein precursor FlgI
LNVFRPGRAPASGAPRALLRVFLCVCGLWGFGLSAAPTVRVKDVAYLRGVRENQLLGVGLVTGLAGRGDSANSTLLQNAIASLVANFGFSISPADVRSRNCAVVTVSCQVPAFVRAGEMVDVRVASLGDARGLEGGVLLQTPLKAANGRVYALAQGQVFSLSTASATSASAQKTVGTVPSGAIVEQEILSDFLGADGTVALILRNPDFVNASKVAAAIKEAFPDVGSRTVDAAMIELALPAERSQDPVGFVAELLAVQLTPEESNKVVIDSATGVIIFGEKVRIGKVAVSYQDLSVQVGTYVSSLAQQQQAQQTFSIPDTTTVDDLVSTLKTIGLDTQAIINIIKAIDRAGSLYGTLIIM